jgi:hypothetical protein
MRHHLLVREDVLHFACTSALIASGCSAHESGPDVAADAGNAACATQAVALGAHPHAVAQPTPLGRTLADTRGWHGRVYFAYGDLEANTGPIVISSYGPISMTWQDHRIGYRNATTGAVMSMDSFATHVIERFVPIGDSLWAPAGQPDFRPFGPAAAPEYAIGSATHEWNEVDIAPDSIHVVDAVERAPNDVLLTGSGLFHDRGTAPDGPRLAGGYVWRSVGGGSFTQIFPTFGATAADDNVDRSGAPLTGAALDGVAYLDEASAIYTVDTRAMTCCSVQPLGQFLRPVAFAGKLVFADLGQLFAFDGTKLTNLGFPLFMSKGRYQGSPQSLSLFQATEGRLLAVNEGGDVMMTSDLATWTCIGKAPADAASIGSLDGVVYFGGIEGRVYGFKHASW